jgi:hypothetical protein
MRRSVLVTGFAVLAAVGATPSCGSGDDPDGSPRDAGAREGAAPVRTDAGSGVGPAREAGAQVTPGPSCDVAADATLAATVSVAVDDRFVLYVNGALVKAFDGTWQSPQTDAVTLFRHPSKKNVIAVEAANLIEVAGADRMVVLDLSYEIDGLTHHVVSDASWKQSGAMTMGWSALDFVEAGWATAVEQGTHGGAPYGAALGRASDAKFIWSYDSGTTDIGVKPDSETVYFRKAFYVDATGAPQGAPTACP